MRSTDVEFVGAKVGGFRTDEDLARAATLSKGTAPKVAYTRESSVENYLRAEAKKRVGKCFVEKHVSPGRRGVPDDLITWGHPLCLMELIETKAPKGRVAGHQQRDHNERARYGITVHTLHTKADVDEYFRLHDTLMELV